MSAEISAEVRARALYLLDRQKQKKRQAEQDRLAASVTVRDLEAFANRVNSAIDKFATAVNRLRSTQIEILDALAAEADPNPVEVIYGQSPQTLCARSRRRQ